MAKLGLFTDIIKLIALTAISNQALDASNDGAGMLWQAPKTGKIRAIGVSWGTKTGTAPTYRLGIEGATSTRVPDGTILESGTAFKDVNNAAITASSNQRYTINVDANVTAGTWYWATVRYQSGTVNASNFVNIQYALTAVPGGWGSPVGQALTAGTWGTGVAHANLWVEYDDGEVVGIGHTVSAQSWSSSGPPLYRGTCWTPPIACDMDSILLVMRASSSGCDFNVHVVEGTNATPVKSITVAESIAGSPSNPAVWSLPCRLSLKAETPYRFMVEPTTTTAIASFARFNFIDTTFLDAIGCGRMKASTATSLGTYSDNTTSWYPIVPVLSGINIGCPAFAVMG